MLRSYTTLARTLNLSKTVATLGYTRQTVRRHIDLLEKLKGAKLVELNNKRYSLTEAGKICVVEAEALLADVDAWVAGRRISSHAPGRLAYATYRDGDQYEFHAQQQPLARLHGDSEPLLKAGFRAWAEAEFEIEHPAMAALRSHMVVYRKHRDDWFVGSIGEDSAYAKWMSWTWAKSAIGRPVSDSPTNEEVTEFVTKAYDQVLTLGNARFDHLFTQLSRHQAQKPEPVGYQRLLLYCLFPDGSAGVASLIALTDRLDIDGLDTSMVPKSDVYEPLMRRALE
jgi:hypothetical protein